MEEKENIPVYIKVEKGKTVCICHACHKRCSRNCPIDIVERDRYNEWQSTMNNKYGK